MTSTDPHLPCLWGPRAGQGAPDGKSNVKPPCSGSSCTNVFGVKQSQRAGHSLAAGSPREVDRLWTLIPATDCSSFPWAEPALARAWVGKQLVLHIPWAAGLKQHFDRCSFSYCSEMLCLPFIRAWLMLLSAIRKMRVDGNIEKSLEVHRGQWQREWAS